jgi:hypothetical protein
MRTINSAFRLALPLLAAGCAALFGACAPGPVAATYGAPQISNIYSIDLENGQPSVLIYSNQAATGSDPRVSAKPPPAYSAFQVEFDQPMTGATLANREDRATAALGSSTFCSDVKADGTLGAQAVQLLDGATVIPSSICYDPASDIGGNPHVTIIPGNGLVGGTPFTCQTFSRASTNNYGVLVESHAYTLAFKPGINGANGQALRFPTDAGWAASQYTFTTAGMALMAAGFTDPVSGYFSWLEKPYPGFMKDLNEAGKAGTAKTPATCTQDSSCQRTQQPDPNVPQPPGQLGQICAAGVCAYRQQVATYGGAQTPSPFLIFTTEVLPGTITGVTVTRGTPAVDVTAFFTVDASFDPRVITVTPNATWEGGANYTVNVPASLAGASGATTLGTAKAFSFAAGATPLAAQIPPSPDESSVAVSIGTNIVVTYPVPLDPTKAVPAASATAPGIKLLKAGTLVPINSTGILDPTAQNNQVITITPASNLDAGTVYTVSITGLTSATGAPVTDYSYTFTTRFFNATAMTNWRLVTAPVTALASGITVTYTEAASNLGASTINVFENALTGTAVPVTVTAAANGKSATLTSTAAGKFNQKYVVQSTTALKSVRGVNLIAEGCQPAPGVDCSDVKGFTTAPFGGRLAITTPNKSLGKFTFTFNNPADPVTLTPFLTTSPNPQPGSTDAFQLFKQDALGNRTPVPISCTSNVATATQNTVVTCTAVTPPFNSTPATSNVTYIASAGFPAPGVKSAAAAANGNPVVPASMTTGGTLAFATPCFP